MAAITYSEKHDDYGDPNKKLSLEVNDQDAGVAIIIREIGDGKNDGKNDKGVHMKASEAKALIKGIEEAIARAEGFSKK